MAWPVKVNLGAFAEDISLPSGKHWLHRKLDVLVVTFATFWEGLTYNDSWKKNQARDS